MTGGMVMLTRRGGGGGGSEESEEGSRNEEGEVSLVALLIAALRKSMVAGCHPDHSSSSSSLHQNQKMDMEIGWPTNVEHLSHVTFDRFHGCFLGLPLEFQVELPSPVPSASVSVFGVSPESMQCSFDSRGNSVPTILLLMQQRLYAQGGLNAEGIFRINAENSKEEEVRNQLNQGTVPPDIEVHCLAGLIKAWFRELPCGVLDGLSPQEVLQCNTEDQCADLLKHLKPTESALLNWAVDLMSDVVEHQDSNKMNARNIAMVFAPNMTQMSDPLTALMHAVQVMNLLKTLITKTLREREEAGTTDGGYSPMSYRSEEIETSCELTGQASSEADIEEDEDEVESLSEMEESFLKQLMENENAKDCFKKELGNLVKQRSSPTSGFDFQEESSVMTDGYTSGMSVSPGVGTQVECVK